MPDSQRGAFHFGRDRIAGGVFCLFSDTLLAIIFFLILRTSFSVMLGDAMQCNAMQLRRAFTNSRDKSVAPERLNPSLAANDTSVASPVTGAMALVCRLRVAANCMLPA
jgi:hypothetical protein